MPADIVGTNLIAEDEQGRRQFQFEPGPIFANLVLADEINRATPKTQSAMLEAMQEHSVTVAKADPPAARAVLRAGHPEPAGNGRHLSAARSPARPLLLQNRCALPFGQMSWWRSPTGPLAQPRPRPPGRQRRADYAPCRPWRAACRSPTHVTAFRRPPVQGHPSRGPGQPANRARLCALRGQPARDAGHDPGWQDHGPAGRAL